MNQNIIYDYLRNQYLSGNKDFFTIKEVIKALREARTFNGNAKNTSRMISKLYDYGYLEIENPYKMRRKFRIKPSVIGISEAVSPLSKDIAIKDFRALK